MVYQLVYTSQAGRGLDFRTFQKLAENKRDQNKARDITGILLYASGTIVHVLEGPKMAVKSLYETISRDTRHSEVVLMAESDTRDREFSGQALAVLSVKAGQGSAMMKNLSMQAFQGTPAPQAPSVEDENCLFAQALSV